MKAGRSVGKFELPNVKKIIAVASGKGGVGKSTTAVNIAVSLAREDGFKVGLLDADIYGPSIPHMMNLSGRPQVSPDQRMIPMENFRVRCMSMGFLMDKDAAATWRGPMVMSALESFIRNVDWGRLDVLVVDMPPGTGDAQLTIGQRLALSGAVIVSTPQDIALLDARRGVTMFDKISVPSLGIVENMSFHQCKACGHKEFLFGEDGAVRTADELGLEVLGQIPLNIAIRETSDAGAPISASDPSSSSAQAYHRIAARIKEKLFDPAQQSQQAPSIVN